MYDTVFEGQDQVGMLKNLTGTEELQGRWVAQGLERSGMRFDSLGLELKYLILR